MAKVAGSTYMAEGAHPRIRTGSLIQDMQIPRAISGRLAVRIDRLGGR